MVAAKMSMKLHLVATSSTKSGNSIRNRDSGEFNNVFKEIVDGSVHTSAEPVLVSDELRNLFHFSITLNDAKLAVLIKTDSFKSDVHYLNIIGTDIWLLSFIFSSGLFLCIQLSPYTKRGKNNRQPWSIPKLNGNSSFLNVAYATLGMLFFQSR